MSRQILQNVRKNVTKLSPYIPGKPIREVQEEYGLSEVAKLASNENPIGPSKKVQAAIQSVLGELHRYPDGGSTELKRAIAQKHDVTPEHILVGNGSDELIKMLSETFLHPGDEVVMPAPSFSQYVFGTLLMDGSVNYVPLAEGFEYDLDAILRAITPRTKMVYLCTPNNPTGTYIRKEAFAAFMRKLPEGVLIVLDEAYYEYVTAADAVHGLSFVREGYPVVVLHTFSKLYALAGLRVGYLVADPSIVQEINRVREPFNVNTVAQVAAVTALDDTEHVQTSIEVNESGKKQLYSAFERLGLTYIPTQTNFILVDTKRPSKEVFQQLLKVGVIIRSGEPFGLSTWIRVSVGTQEENIRLIEALEQI
ncbi:histidinol-phosphate transaminase [Fodinisporobacter ferrooxydans]|uniref:Histidinol-phosphate aminotransferase n=1 Tax=Fodinisporobacter ferrooxydans TaxID=2901836 RepID=A0ABY4CJQ9_9BACL|nr:histidinol-phosphate transaminase [Alicyclobacillaceae bacterium MYW30-H2]